MRIIINQFFGIGDIIFCMTIARRLQAQGYEITWPVLPQFLEGLKRAYPDIIFCDWRTLPINYEDKGEKDVWIDGVQYRVLPLRWNVEILGVPYDQCMKTKYQLVGMDWNDWKEGAMWMREEDKEQMFLDSFKGKKNGFVFVNEIYGSESKMTRGIIPKTDLPVLFMKAYEGFSLFDWAKVLENATEVHTVSTSLFYLLELLGLKCPIHLYSRPNDPHFKHIDYLFSKPYILHT